MNTSSLPSYYATEFLTSWNAADIKGRGSFGCVRKCEHSKLGKVAVKCFQITGSSEKCDKARRQIQHEVNVLSCLRHKNIVKIFGETKWANNTGIILEYIDNGNLEDLLLSKDVSDIPWLLRLRFFCEIADGLSHIHHYDKRKGSVHGDLKPQNILVTSDMVIKIADFGSADIALASGKGNASITFSPTKQYTEYYASPEVLKNPEAKRKQSMDVYSFAMVAYEILTRHQVFQGCPNRNIAVQAIIDRGQKPDVTLLRDVESSLKDRPQDLEIFLFLESIINECWDFDAGKRPDIREVREQTMEKLRKLDPLEHSYHIDRLRLKRKIDEKSQNSVKIKLDQFHYPYEEATMTSSSHMPGTDADISPAELQQLPQISAEESLENVPPPKKILLEAENNQRDESKLALKEKDQTKGNSSETLIDQLKVFSAKENWSEADGPQLLSLWCQVYELKDPSLLKRAAKYFPIILKLSFIALNEDQVVAMSEVLKYRAKYIHRIEMVACNLNLSTFPHFSAALVESEATIGYLLLDDNRLRVVEYITDILPKIKYHLNLFNGFSDGGGGSRFSSREEQNRIQVALNKLQNQELDVRVGGATGNLRWNTM